MTANASSSPTAEPSDGMPWLESGLLAPLATALLAGRDTDLIAPMRFLPPGTQPDAARPDATLPQPLADRAALARGLAEANASYGHPGAESLAEKLANPLTRVVVTGQQPGLFGGPLYAFTKMVAAARWAAELERSGTPAVAVFWVATEDHDWSEVAHAAFGSTQGARDLSLGADPSPLTPVGMRIFGPQLDQVFASLAELQPGPREGEFRDVLRRWYRPDARFGEAFCRLATHLLGERCPLLLDAMLPAVKSAERPFLRQLALRGREINLAVEQAEARATARGYSLQVEPQPDAAQLFFLHGGARRRVLWDKDGTISLRGGPSGWPLGRLLEAIEDNPGTVSPGVLSRPAIQDGLLGTTLQVLGPGELSYMAQASAVYPVLGVAAPWVTLRPQALILESALRRHLSAGDLAPLLDPKLPLERLVAQRSGPNIVVDVRAQMDRALAELSAPALALDPTLERPLEKTREQIVRALDAFSGKVDGAVARRDGTLLARMERLREACLPLGSLQERVLSTAHFAGRFGEAFVTALWTQLDLDPQALQLISPDATVTETTE